MKFKAHETSNKSFFRQNKQKFVSIVNYFFKSPFTLLIRIITWKIFGISNFRCRFQSTVLRISIMCQQYKPIVFEIEIEIETSKFKQRGKNYNQKSWIERCWRLVCSVLCSLRWIQWFLVLVRSKFCQLRKDVEKNKNYIYLKIRLLQSFSLGTLMQRPRFRNEFW